MTVQKLMDHLGDKNPRLSVYLALAGPMGAAGAILALANISANFVGSFVPLFALISRFLARALQQDDSRTVAVLAQLLPYSEKTLVTALDSFVAQAEALQQLQGASLAFGRAAEPQRNLDVLQGGGPPGGASRNKRGGRDQPGAVA